MTIGYDDLEIEEDWQPLSRLPIGSSLCECTGCGLIFKSPSAFDMHRIGIGNGETRCATIAEMQAKGMCINAKGWWVTRGFTFEAAIAEHEARRHG